MAHFNFKFQKIKINRKIDEKCRFRDKVKKNGFVPKKCQFKVIFVSKFVGKSFKHKIFQRYKDMNLTDWDELNSIDLRTGLATKLYGPYSMNA